MLSSIYPNGEVKQDIWRKDKRFPGYYVDLSQANTRRGQKNKEQKRSEGKKGEKQRTKKQKLRTKKQKQRKKQDKSAPREKKGKNKELKNKNARTQELKEQASHGKKYPVNIQIRNQGK